MRRLALGTALALVLIAAIAISAHAIDRNTRPVGPVQLWEAGKMAGFSDAWLQVKFVERSEVRLEDGRFVDPSGLDLTKLNEVVQREAVRIVRPMLSHDRSLLRSWKDAGERRAGVVGPDLSLWFDIHIDGGAAAVARLVNSLNELPCVEIAHPAPIPQSLTMTGSRVVIADREASATGAAAQSREQRMAGDRTPDFSGLQGYLYDPPIGFGAPAAWAYPGGLGAGERVIDLELFAGPARHEDFDPAKLFYEDGVSPNYSNHELAALGEVIGAHNGFGIRGFAPEALYGVQNFDVDTMGEYCQRAIDQLDYGDVWYIEVGVNFLPLEGVQACYDVIWTGVWGRGITCVEAAGNSHINLDDPGYEGMFDRNVRDSGAIMVAAGHPEDLDADEDSNYGSRIDVNGWGERIVTAGYGDLYNGGSPETRYTAMFSHTSGATGMVAGAAVSLLGISRVYFGTPVDPYRLRSVLHETGTPHTGDREIGTRPNLVLAVPALLDVTSAPEPILRTAWRISAQPNPFAWSTEFSIESSDDSGTPLLEALTSSLGTAAVSLFDAGGRKVRSLPLWPGAPASLATRGGSRIVWDGRDDAGRCLPNGVYLYRIDGRGLQGTGRVTLVR